MGLLFVLVGSVLFPTSVFGHTTVEVEPYKIEVGWETEPPIVGIRNDLVSKITESGETEGTYKGVTSAFKNLEAKIRFGGITKNLDINSDPRPGYYFSPIIPTKIGTYFLDLKGEINNIPINVQIPIEDVEGTSVLDFPLTGGRTSDSEVAAMKNAISSLQKEVSQVKEGDETSKNNNSGGFSYEVAAIATGLGSAGILLAVFAMTRKK